MMSHEPESIEEVAANGRHVHRRVRVDIEPLDSNDTAFVRHKWRACFHLAPGKRRIPWAAYKATFGAMIDALLERDDTWILAAYDADRRVRGFIAWTPGNTPVVHYVWVRPRTERQGIAMRLIDEAQLGPRWWYTFRGVRVGSDASTDAHLVAALAGRGIEAKYLPAAKYLGRIA